ncbi:transmembrane E3 ubiquitin-protein ligase, partial [Phenoliferia sp. Uapishka_3]
MWIPVLEKCSPGVDIRNQILSGIHELFGPLPRITGGAKASFAQLCGSPALQTTQFSFRKLDPPPPPLGPWQPPPPAANGPNGASPAPPATAGGIPARGPILPTTTFTAAQIQAIRQQQQRPQNNMSSFIFLSILFFLLSNNGNEAAESASQSGGLDRLKSNLERRELRRDGLAQWLGLNTTYAQWNFNSSNSQTSNSTNTTLPPQPIPFTPDPHSNPALTPLLDSILVPNPSSGGMLYYTQNLTGLTKGNWQMGDWSWDKLGLEEAYNTTREVEQKLEPEGGASKGKGVFAPVEPPSELGKVVSPEGDIPEPRDPLERRADLAEVDTKPGLELISPLAVSSPNITMVNVTTTTNRTLSRGSFPWSSGGKLTLQLVEDQTSAVGAVELPKGPLEDGKLLVETRVEGPREGWEEEGPVTYLRGELTIYSKTTSDSLSLDVEGVHFLSKGTFYAFATPSTLPTTYAFEVPGLPLYSPSSSSNNSAIAAGHAILHEVDRRIARDRLELFLNGDSIILPPPSSSTSSTIRSPFDPVPDPTCTFTLYGRLSPLPSWYSPAYYAEYYLSLFHPTGSSLLAPPRTKILYAMYSEDCGIVIEGEEPAELTPIPEAWSRATNLAVILGVVQGVMLWALVRQMSARASMNSLAKLAHASVGMQAAMDSYTFIATFTVSVAYNSRASFPTLIPCFFALVSSLCFGMRHASDIRSSYPPPPPRPVPPPPPTREALAANAAETRRRTEAGEAATPVVTVTTPVVEEENDGWFLALGCAIAFGVLLIVVVWGWIALMVVIFYSYWIPQIIMNVQRGAARMTLKREYIVVTTIGRLFLPVYFLGCPNNLLGAETTKWIIPLVLYSTTQALLLLLQDSRLGARFFLPTFALRRFGITTEEIWEYHPILNRDLESSALLPPEDCPICMEEIETGDKEDRELGNKGRARWGYMVPPCGHTCHTKCLEAWMQIKNVCPVCRGRLPPL